MLGHKPVGERVTVFDSEGYFMGYSLAERLAREGRHVTLVTNHHQLSPYSHLTSEAARVSRGIRELGVEVVTDHILLEIEEGQAVVRGHWGDAPRRLTADSTVLVTQRYSDDGPCRALKADPAALERAGIVAVHRIGDCYAPNFIAEAIFSGPPG
jgi:dimethylamine/trimethylamine dehydrogenase